jgi:hypothetical protein
VRTQRSQGLALGLALTAAPQLVEQSIQSARLMAVEYSSILIPLKGRAKFNSPLRGDNRRNPLSPNAQTFEAKPSRLNQFTHRSRNVAFYLFPP